MPERKYPGKHPETWRKSLSAAKHPHFTPRTWRKCARKRKCPEKHPETWRKCERRRKCPAKRPETWRKSLSTAKHPHFTARTWRKCARKRKCPGKHHISGRNHRSGKEMSRKPTFFQNKPPRRIRNVPGNATKPGETPVPGGKCPEKHPETWRESLSTAKHPHFTPRTWRKCARKRKCPWKRHKTGRNPGAGRKMSRKPTFFQDKPSLRKRNVPGNATFPGHTIAQDGDYRLGNPS